VSLDLMSLRSAGAYEQRSPVSDVDIHTFRQLFFIERGNKECSHSNSMGRLFSRKPTSQK